MDLPLTADLHALAKALKSDTRYSRVPSWVKSAELAQACISDLRQSMACTDALLAIAQSQRGKGTLQRLTTENSLLFTAVVFYARATATVGTRGERGAISLNARFTPDQLTDHNHLKDVRDQVISHAYPGRSVSNQIWHESTSLLVETENGWRPAIIARSAAFDKPTFNVLQRHVPLACDLMLERFNEYIKRITELLHRNPISYEEITRHLVDPVPALGGSKRAADALNGASEPGRQSSLYHD